MYSKGNARNRIVKHLGPVRKRSDIDRYRREFLIYSRKQEPEKINLGSLRISNSLEFGFYYATRHILNRTGIGNILEYHLGDCAELAGFLIACSIAMPSRRQPLSEVLSNTYYPWLGRTSRDQLFKTLDSMVKHKEGIESDVFGEIRPVSSEVTCFVVSSRFTTIRHKYRDKGSSTAAQDSGRGQIICIAMLGKLPVYCTVWDRDCELRDRLYRVRDVLLERFGLRISKLVVDFPRTGRTLSDIPEDWQYIAYLSRWAHPYRDILLNTPLSSLNRFGDSLAGIVQSPEVDLRGGGDPASSPGQNLRSRLAVIYSHELEILDTERFRSENEGFSEAEFRSSNQRSHVGDFKFPEPKEMVNNGPPDISQIEPEILMKIAGRRILLVDASISLENIVSEYRSFLDLERRFSSLTAFTELRLPFEWKDGRLLAHVCTNALGLYLERIIEAETRMTLKSAMDILSTMKALPTWTESGAVILRTDSAQCDRMLSKLSIPVPGRVIGHGEVADIGSFLL